MLFLQSLRWPKTKNTGRGTTKAADQGDGVCITAPARNRDSQINLPYIVSTYITKGLSDRNMQPLWWHQRERAHRHQRWRFATARTTTTRAKSNLFTRLKPARIRASNPRYKHFLVNPLTLADLTGAPMSSQKSSNRTHIDSLSRKVHLESWKKEMRTKTSKDESRIVD